MQNKTDKIALAIVEQRATLTDRGRDLLSFVAPILTSYLMSINKERIDDLGVSRDRILLRQLAYLPKPGDDGAHGDAFEYALHRSVRGCDRAVVDPLFEVLYECGVPAHFIDSIFFARDKQGEAVLIDPDPHLIDEQTLIVPGHGRPPMAVHEHLDIIGKALHSNKYRSQLPDSISGFWKADLLIGNCRANQWLGATVKSNRSKLTKAPGLALGIVPGALGRSSAPRRDGQLDMWIVEVPYDNQFMELFSCAWQIVTAFLNADAGTPKTNILGDSESRRVAAMLESTRHLPVLEVVKRLTGEGQAGMAESSTAEVTTLAMGGKGEIAGTTAAKLYALPLTSAAVPVGT